MQQEESQDHMQMKFIESAKKKESIFKRGATMMQNDDDGKHAFEDSRETMLLFEKYKLIELVRFYLISSCSALTIIDYEYAFNLDEDSDYNNEIDLLLYVIMITSIIISILFVYVKVLLTILSYQVRLVYLKAAMMATPQVSLTQSNLFYSLLIEILILLPTPTPYTRFIKIPYTLSDVDYFYWLNEFLIYLMMFRIIISGIIILKFHPTYRSQVGRLCRIYSAEHGPHFTLKICARDLPLTTLSSLFVIGMFVFAYTLEIAERPAKRGENFDRWGSISNSLWITLITLPTIGYGDFYPITTLGRITVTICLFFGISLASLFVACLLNMLQPTNGEQMAWALLAKANARKSIQKYSLGIIKKVFQTYQAKKKNVDIREENLEKIQMMFQNQQNLKRAYRDIDGEDMLSMARRKFRELSNIYEVYRQDLKKVKQQQRLIMLAIEKPMEFSFKSNTLQFSSIKKQKENEQSKYHPTASPNTHQSKDDYFFENLHETSKDPYLMNFDEN